MLLAGGLFAVGLCLVILDACKKIKLVHPVVMTPFLILALNLPVWGYWSYNTLLAARPTAARIAVLAAAGGLVLYLWLRLSVFPVLDGRRMGFRLKAMIGGRTIVHYALWAMALQIAWFALGGRIQAALQIPGELWAGNGVYSVVMLLALFANGVLRMFFTSRRLSILRRLVIVFTVWIPVVNLAVLARACKLVYEEYDHAVYKRELQLVRADSDLCRTRYPLVMVHGVFFRDWRYWNYWGRIPRELMRYGAAVHYGNQESVGSIEDNAADIRNKIQAVLAETGCEKVNIIAHSKGGLDARLAVVGLEDRVASLTTIGTPHRGCRFVDMALKIPPGLFAFLARTVDAGCRKTGEHHPDFDRAIHQFATPYSEEFNRTVPDAPGVYYQSYACKMNGFRSDLMLGLTHWIIRGMEGENDGLVSTASAMWGEFRGVIASSGRKGVSHGDIIDLKREDYKGFDVVETYVQMVGELKSKGY